MPWMNFSAHAVDWEKLFLSETGYCSFMGVHAELVSGLTPDAFAVEAITWYVKTGLKGRLLPIQPRDQRPAIGPIGVIPGKSLNSGGRKW